MTIALVAATVIAVFVAAGVFNVSLRVTRPTAPARTHDQVVWHPTEGEALKAAPPDKDVVYIIRAGRSVRVKVGTTRNLEARLRKIQTDCAGEPTVIEAILPGGRVLEQRLHTALADYHVRLEWFDLPHDGEGWRQVVDHVHSQHGGAW